MVTTGAGSPKAFIKKCKEAGIIVIPVVPSVAIAKKMELEGADAVVAEGTEAGGHVGETTTIALVPQIVDAVNIPVIAAGGISDGRGMVAAYALCAKGVQIGTRFMATYECQAHNNYKQYSIEAGDSDTVVTGRSLGGPVRNIKNPMTLEYLAYEKRGASREELEELTIGSLRRAVVEGNTERGSIMAEQISGMIEQVTSVEEVITSIINEAEEVQRKLRLN